MKLQLTRIDTTLPIPAYQTQGSVAFDLYSRIDCVAEPLVPTIIPLNVIIKVPVGYVLILASRSSTPLKKHLMVANGIGVIDQDYYGPTDELGLQVVNFSREPVRIEKGERICQAMLVKIARVEGFRTIQKRVPSRGGFGSTGSK